MSDDLKSTASNIVGAWSMFVFVTAVWPILIWLFFFTDYHGQFLAFIQPGYDDLTKEVSKELIPMFEGKAWRDVLGSLPFTFVIGLMVLIEYLAIYVYPILLAIGAPVFALYVIPCWSLRKSILVVLSVVTALLAPQLLYTYNLKQELLNGKVELTDFEAEITRLYPSMQEALRQGLRDRAESGDLTIIPLLEKYASEFGPRKDSDEYFSLNMIHEFMGGPKRYLLNEDISSQLLATISRHGDTQIYKYTEHANNYLLALGCLEKKDRDSCFAEILPHETYAANTLCLAAERGYSHILEAADSRKNGYAWPECEVGYGNEKEVVLCTIAKNLGNYDKSRLKDIRTYINGRHWHDCKYYDNKTKNVRKRPVTSYL